MHKLYTPIRLLSLAAVILAGTVLAPSILAQSGGVKGKVRNTRGDSIPNATITARQEGADIKTVTSNSKGDFQMTGLKSGVYNFYFEADGYGSGMLFGIEIKNSVRDLGNRLILAVDQGTQVIVRGSVFFREGTSVTGAKVDLALVNPDGTTRNLGSTYTTVSGDFTFRRPRGPAKLRVTARYKGVTASNDIEVSYPAIYRTAITLDLSRNDR
jgi:hypothetical protein